MSTNISPYSGVDAQVVRGTPVGGADVQHVIAADASGNLVGSSAVGSERGLITQQPAVTVTGTLAAAGETVQALTQGYGGCTISTTGTWTGTIGYEVSQDGVTWSALVGNYSGGAAVLSGQNTTNQTMNFNVGGFLYVRIRAFAWTSGTAAVTITLAPQAPGVRLHSSLPPGTNSIGTIGNAATNPAGVRLSDGGGYLNTVGGKLSVDNSGQTQPVSDAGGSLTVDSAQLPSALVSDRLAVDGSGVTQPVSIAGTVPVADAGGSLTVDAPQASPLHVRITDGTNNAAVMNSEPSTSTYGAVVRAIQQSTPTYWAVYDRIAPAANKYMAVLWNTTATRVVKVRRIWRMDWQVTAVVGILLEQEVRLITARTGVGTTVTPTPLDSADTLTAGIEASHNATGVTDGGMLSRIFAASEEVILAATGQVLGFSSDERYQIVYEESRGSAKPITLRQNRGLAIKNITSSTIGTVSYIFEFTDEAV